MSKFGNLKEMAEMAGDIENQIAPFIESLDEEQIVEILKNIDDGKAKELQEAVCNVKL